jgi:hypothetical protein
MQLSKSSGRWLERARSPGISGEIIVVGGRILPGGVDALQGIATSSSPCQIEIRHPCFSGCVDFFTGFSASQRLVDRFLTAAGRSDQTNQTSGLLDQRVGALNQTHTNSTGDEFDIGLQNM